VVSTDGTAEVYNLTVDEAHTYFVGDGAWLVHNACPSDGAGGGVKYDIRFIDDGSTFDVAFGVGEDLPAFANSFQNPPALYWREWPDSLIRKNGVGLDLPIRANQILILNQPGIMAGSIPLIMNRIRDQDFIGNIPAIRFNLARLNNPRLTTTVQELSYILQDDKLFSMTHFYTNTMPVSGAGLDEILDKINLKRGK